MLSIDQMTSELPAMTLRHSPRPGSRLLKVAALAVLCMLTWVAGCGGSPEARRKKFFASGNAYLEKGQLKEAIIEFRNAVEADPKFADGYARLAETYGRLGDGSNALGAYVRAADLMPDALDIQLSAGRYLLASGRFDDALSRADAVIARDPQNVSAHVLRGNALGGLNDLDASLAALEEAIRLDPNRGSSYTQLGVLELARGRREQARAALQKAVELDPKWIGGYLALANQLWASGEYAEAERSLQRALEIEPSNETANRAMAALAIATNRAADAERFLKAIAGDRARPSGTLALADYYMRAGRAPEAIAQLEALMRQDGTVPGAKLRLVQALTAAGQQARAATLLEEVLAADKGDAEAWLLKAQMLHVAGHRDEALDTARRAIEVGAGSAPAHFFVGQLYAARGDVNAARRAFMEVLRLNPRAAAAQVELSRLQLAAGLTDASTQTARDAARNEPQNLAARLTLVRSLLASKDVAGAQRELTALRASHGSDASVQVLSGILAAQTGDGRSARATLEGVLRTQPANLEALAALVSLDVAGGNPSAARARLDDRLKSGSSAPLLLLSARVAGSMGDVVASERFLRDAIAMDATFLPAYSALGQLYVTQRRLGDAREEFDALASRDSHPVAALTMSGMILQAQGDIDGAVNRYERAVALDSAAAVASNNLAWIQAERGRDLDGALQLAQAAAKARPDTPEIVDTLGWIYYKKNLPEQALPLLRQNVDRAPLHPVYRYRLGLAQLQSGNEEDGRRTLERALALGADGAIAEDIRRTLGGGRQ